MEIKLTMSNIMGKKNSYQLHRFRQKSVQCSHCKSGKYRYAIGLPKSYQTWEEWTALEVKSQVNAMDENRKMIIPISTYQSVHFAFFFQNKKHPDIDNALTGVCDVLELAGVFTDDKYIVPVCDLPKFGRGNGCEVTIRMENLWTDTED